MKTEFFNSERFGLVLQRQAVLHYKTWLTAIISVAGSIMFIAFLNMLVSQNDSWIGIYNNMGVIAFFITGLVFASLSFSEMGTYSKSLQYITLPATQFEKFLAAWLISSVFYLLASVVVIVFSSALSGVIAVLVFKRDFLVFDPFTLKMAEAVLAYFIAHSAFFLGAVWFKKAAFFKTLLTMFVVNIIVNTWLFAWMIAIINPFSMFIARNDFYIPLDTFARLQPMIKTGVMSFFIVLSAIFLITSWIRFKEREV